jgi:hypothetical protein
MNGSEFRVSDRDSSTIRPIVEELKRITAVSRDLENFDFGFYDTASTIATLAGLMDRLVFNECQSLGRIGKPDLSISFEGDHELRVEFDPSLAR